MSNTVAEKYERGQASERAGLYAADGGRKYLNLAERRRVLAAIQCLEPDKALFALTLAWTGARVSEVLALTPASFQVDAGIVAIITLKRRKLSVREIPIPASLTRAIDVRFGIQVAQRDPLMASRRLWPWHRVTAWRIVKDLMQLGYVTGLPACPRGFRHGFGVGALQAGVPLNLLQRWLGHARISTTAIYANASGPDERSFAAGFWRQGQLTPE